MTLSGQAGTLVLYPGLCLVRADPSFLKLTALTINKAPGMALGMWWALSCSCHHHVWGRAKETVVTNPARVSSTAVSLLSYMLSVFTTLAHPSGPVRPQLKFRIQSQQ